MIDPLNPGPAGNQGPAGVTVGPPGPGVIDGVLQYGTLLIRDAIATATTAIRSLVDQSIATVQLAIGKTAGQVAGAINQGETALTLAGAQAKTAIGNLISGGAPTGPPPNTAEGGATPGQFRFNIFHYHEQPYPTRVTEQTSIVGADMREWCFRGGSDEFSTATTMAQGWYGQRPPDWCFGPSGVAAGPLSGPVQPGTCASNVYHVWQQFLPDGSANCVELCEGVAGPSGFKDMGISASPGVNAPVGTVYQCIPPSKGTGGGPQYYAGCVSGKAVSWLSTDPTPGGVTGQVGPFSDQGVALAAASCGGTGTGTGNGTGSTSMCCDPTTGEIKLPKCIYFDLCDWEKFKSAMRWAIYHGLCDFITDPNCQCPIHDDLRFEFDDCEGTVGPAIKAWVGNLAGRVANAPSIDDVVSDAEQYYQTMP